MSNKDELKQDELKAKLLEAAFAGDLPRADQLIRQGADVDTYAGKTLVANADPHYKDLDGQSRSLTGMTPLCLAIKSGNTDLVDFLIKKGADVNMGDGWGRTPLHYSVGTGQVGTTEILLRHGAIANAEDDNGNTPLHYLTNIVSEADPTSDKMRILAEMLVNHGADVNHRN